jgi:hypothetical protein
MKRISAVLLIIFLGLWTGCGGGGGGGEKQDITVSLSPQTVTVAGDDSQTFTATILNPHNNGVTWNLSGAGCTGSGCGTLSYMGGNSNQGWTCTYTAPLTVPNPPTVTLTATSVDDKSKSSSATITVTAPVVKVSLTPAAPTVPLGGTQQFTATVKGTTNTAVDWSLTGPGTVSNGLYTAPASLTTPATVTVTATSQADNTKSASASITIPAVQVSILPLASNVLVGATQQFTATVENAMNTAVTWSSTGPGSVNSSGLYTAPATLTTPATASVKATSQADPSKSLTIIFTIPAVSVTVSPSNKTLGGGQSQVFTATVNNAVDKSVTWSVTGPGSIDTGGKYTAPPVVAASQTVTVKATSKADPSKSGSVDVALIPISVAVLPASVTVPLNTTQQFTAKVDGTSNQAVTWSVSGTGCSGNTCGTISSSGLYAAPASLPSPPTVTVSAASADDPTKIGSATVTLTTNANAKLNGHYAFYFQAYDSMGRMEVSIGSFTADGNGNLTNGLRDVNVFSVPVVQQQSFTGSYLLHADGRGTMTFNMSSGGCTFRFSINGSGDKGYMVEIDYSGAHGGGLLRKQDTSDFLLSKITGSYAFGFAGVSLGGERNAAVGRLDTNGAGGVSNAVMDTNEVSNVAIGGSFSMNSSTGAANGRATMTFTVQGTTFHFGAFMVDDNEMFAMIEDQTGLDVPLIHGTILRQTGAPFSSSALSGAAVFYWNGQSQVAGTTSALIGRLSASGTNTLSGEYALSDGGVPTQGNFSSTNVSVSTNGRALFDATTLGRIVFYLVGPNKAFLIRGTELGMLEPQVLPAGGLKLSDLQGHYFNRNAEIVLQYSGAFSATLDLDNAGAWSGYADISSAAFSDVGDQYVTGQLTLASATSGRITNTQIDPGAAHHILYAVTTDKVLILDNDHYSANQGVLWQTTGFWEK